MAGDPDRIPGPVDRPTTEEARMQTTVGGPPAPGSVPRSAPGHPRARASGVPAPPRSGPRRTGRTARRERGSAVTYAVAGFMLVALLVYLVVAYFADEAPPGEAAPGRPPAADERP